MYAQVNDLNDPIFFNKMKDKIKQRLLQTTCDAQELATTILNKYISDTKRHIWLVQECGECLIPELKQQHEDIEMYKVNLEFHDRDKLSDEQIIPIFAIINDYSKRLKKKDNAYTISQDTVNQYNICWNKHLQNNKHHIQDTSSENISLLNIAQMVADEMAIGVTHNTKAKDYFKDKHITFGNESLNTIFNDMLDEQEKNNNIINWYKRYVATDDFVPPEQEKIEQVDDKVVEQYSNEELSKELIRVEPDPEYKPQLFGNKSHPSDTLAIGEISTKNINMKMVQFLYQFEQYLDVLQKWFNWPNYELLPKLQQFGIIIDSLYQINMDIKAYRALRVGFTTKPNQNVMGLIDNGRYFKRPKDFVKPGYKFKYMIDGPTSVARSIWVTKVYGDLIMKTVIKPDTRKLLITNELTYILQKMYEQGDHGSARPMNLSTRSQVILFPGQELDFQVITLTGDISDELQQLTNPGFVAKYREMKKQDNATIESNGQTTQAGGQSLDNFLLDTIEVKQDLKKKQEQPAILPQKKQQKKQETKNEVLSNEGLFGKVVEQKDPTHYIINKFPMDAFFARLRKKYKTSKMEHLLKAVGISQYFSSTHGVLVHKFFIPQILYLLQQFKFSNALYNDILTNTWVGQPIQNKTILDSSLITKNMNCKLYQHQMDFINNYAKCKDNHRLRGYLLSFEQGLGKTITSLALMQALNKDKVIIICPKNTMLETWNNHIETFYNTKQSVYITGITPKYQNQRFCIFNYDAMDKLQGLLGTMKYESIGLIIDESHNFLRSKSLRTQLLIDIATSTPKADVLMMSGTPLKCAGVEMIPLMQVLDPMFDEQAITTFKISFGVNTEVATDVLHQRLTRMMTRVTKDILNLPEKRESIVKVTMPTGKQYTVSSVQKQMINFITDRQKYHAQMMPTYKAEWEECMYYLDRSELAGTAGYIQYRERVDELIAARGWFMQGDKSIAEMNEYQRTEIQPCLPSDLLKKFRHCKAAIKYLRLKIRGEVLGDFLTSLRMKMTSEMLQASNIVELIKEAQKKTLIFTSYVETIELADEYLTKQGFKPISIYGKTSSNLAALVKTFQTDLSFNPLIASLQTLSTGATLTAANRVIFLNKPWRSIEYQQASDRVHRIGQDSTVDIISLVLDTGTEGNLSTRMEDIMNTSASLFDAMVDGKKNGGTLESGTEVWDMDNLPKDTMISYQELKNEESSNEVTTIIKNISFPEEQIPVISKQSRIITTRVSADFDKFQLNDLVKTPWNQIYEVTKRIVINDIKDHPYYKELTEGQIKFLSQYDKIAVLELIQSKSSDEALENDFELFPIELANTLKKFEKYEYACLYKDGILIKDQNEMDKRKGTDIIIQTPASTDKNKAGMCHDMTVYLDQICNKCNVEHVNIYVTSHDAPQYTTHSWVVAKNNQGTWSVLDVFAKEHGYYKQTYDNQNDAIIGRIKLWIKLDNNGSNNLDVFISERCPKSGVDFAIWGNSFVNNSQHFTKWKNSNIPEIANEALSVSVENEKESYAAENLSTSDEQITPETKSVIKNDTVYHSSPLKLDILSGNATKSYSGQKGNVFVTPYKALAQCFIIDRQAIVDEIEKQIGETHLQGLNFQYDVWAKPTSELDRFYNKIIVYVQNVQFKPITGKASGYIYNIKASKYMDKCHMFNKNAESPVQYCIQGDVEYESSSSLSFSYIAVPKSMALDPNSPFYIPQKK